MIDGIIKADGTSRLMRATLPETYAEFRAQCAAGAQPLDVLFNAIGWRQLPTFLNKGNLAGDNTLALFGLSASAVPNDIFSYLSKYAQHWWEVRGVIPAHVVETAFVNKKIALAQQESHYVRVDYADSIDITDDGIVSMVNPQYAYEGTLKNLVPSNLLDNIRGKYFIAKNVSNGSITSGILYCDPSATFTYTTISTDSSYNKGIMVSAGKEITGEAKTLGGYELVHSVNRNAYPNSGEVDGSIYNYLGIPFDNAITAPKIATGSYKGTGTYGASNPCVLQLGFSPKLLFLGTSRYGMFDAVRFLDDIGAEYTAGGVIPASFSFDAITNSGNSTVFNTGLGYTKIENGVLSWYASTTRDPISEGYYGSNLPSQQFNHESTTYYYFAIG